MSPLAPRDRFAAGDLQLQRRDDYLRARDDRPGLRQLGFCGRGAGLGGPELNAQPVATKLLYLAILIEVMREIDLPAI